jgi:hypothetical protein
LGIILEVVKITREHTYVQGEIRIEKESSGVVREWMDVPLQSWGMS